jgi:GT2 family glycosyltransferase
VAAPLGDATATAVTTPGHSTFGVLTTYRRPDDLERSLLAIETQTSPFEELVIVDNDPGERSMAIVDRHRDAMGPVRFVTSPTNLGPAGGRSLGALDILERARDDDLIVFLDDDDPLPTPDIVARVVMTAERMVASDPRTAGVGLRGGRLERWTGQIVPVDGSGTPRVDHLHGNRLPCYRVGPLRRVGLFDADLFFGFEELELGLRLRRAGYTLYADADLYASVRTSMAGKEPRTSPSRLLDAPSLRRYYALRNRLVVLGRERLYLQALSWALVAGVLKPVMWLPIRHADALIHLRVNLTAIADAATGRLGPRRWTERSRVALP